MARIEFTDGSRKDAKFSIGSVEFELVNGSLDTDDADVIAAAATHYNLEVNDEVEVSYGDEDPVVSFDAPVEFNPYEEEDLS